MARSFAPGLLIALAVLTAPLLLSFAVGRYPAGLGDLFDLIAAKFSGHALNIAPTAVDVLLRGRGPRVLTAVLVGAALSIAGHGLSGLVSQSNFRSVSPSKSQRHRVLSASGHSIIPALSLHAPEPELIRNIQRFSGSHDCAMTAKPRTC
jgi:ABC-type enterochelin transport system permease subunit